jgi:hypothetical protein
MALALASAEKVIVIKRTAQTPTATVNSLFLIRSSCILMGLSAATRIHRATERQKTYPHDW